MFTDFEEMLILKSKITIEKVLHQRGYENTAISFSGGRDSTVLKHLVESINPFVLSVFCNTGVEYDSIVKFVKKQSNVKIVKPRYSFWEIVEKYGYPIISKEQSRYIHDIRNPNTSKNIKEIRLGNGRFCLSQKWRWILDTDITASDRCCYYLKKYPLQRLKYYYFTGERTEESSLRKQRYHTCILPKKCVPLRLWTNELIDKYISYHNIKICDIYKHEKRTGCKYCLYGIHLEKKGLDRIDRLKKIEPKSYRLAEIKGLIDIKNLIKGGDNRKQEKEMFYCVLEMKGEKKCITKI